VSLILPPRFWQERKQQADALISALQNTSPLISALAEAGGESCEDIGFFLNGLKSESGFEAFAKAKADRVALSLGHYAPLPLLITASLWALSHGARLQVEATPGRYCAGILEILEHMTYPGFILPGKEASLPRLEVIPQSEGVFLPDEIGNDTVSRITRFNGRAGNSLKDLVLPVGRADEAVFRLVALGGRFTIPHEEERLLTLMEKGFSFRDALRDISSLEKDRFLVTFHAPWCLSLPIIRVTESDSVQYQKQKATQSAFFSLNLS